MNWSPESDPTTVESEAVTLDASPGADAVSSAHPTATAAVTNRIRKLGYLMAGTLEKGAARFNQNLN